MKRQLRNAPTPFGPRCRAGLIGLLLAAPGAAAAADASDLAALKAAVRGVCEGEGTEDAAAASAQGARLLEQSPLVVRGREIGWRRRFAVEGGGRIAIEGIAPGGELRRVRAEYQELAARGLRPLAMALADGRCRIRTGRRLVYASDGRAQAIERLDAALEEVLVREPLDPAVPPAPGFDGVTVAMVDAGVNYLLPRIRDRLARDGAGEVIGYDYWDLDPRPFDANPARSPFFPQRHGTQTASLLLDEAPVAGLAPFRYPRPDMSRMAELVANAAEHGVVVMNLSLGGDRREKWTAFERSARAHPEMLFVVSAGNNGRDIDKHPVYPASLELENMLTITSAEADGRIAPGSNWGRQSVDLLVPGEEMLVTDFHGRPRVVSGASYAAVRVSALAACLLAANPQWRAQELKAEILARAVAAEDEVERRSAHGSLGDPTAGERGACAPSRSELARLSSTVWTGDDLAGGSSAAPAGITHELSPTLVVFDDAGWQLESVRAGVVRARSILAQCGVDIPRVMLVVMDGPKRFKIFREDWATDLVTREQFPRPAVFFVRDTLQEISFDAEAVGRSNARGRPALRDTVWMTSAVEHVGVSLAHELYHVVADGGAHDPDPANLMHERTEGENTALRAGQCLRLVTVGESLGTLSRVGQ